MLILTILTGACLSYKTPVRNSNVAYIYNPGSTTIYPQYKVFHNLDTASTVFIKIKSTELLYIKKLNNPKPQATVQIHYKLFDSLEENNIQDSATYLFYIEKDTSNKEIIVDISIKAQKGKTYMLDIIATDKIRNKGNQQFIKIDKTNEYSSQNFLIIDKTTEEPVFKKYFNKNEKFYIKHKFYKNKKIRIRYFNKQTKLPSPPFSVFIMKSYNFLPDSMWVVQLTDTTVFSLPKYGMYNFSIDTINQSGLTVFNFGMFFPEIKTSFKLLEPLRYLTTSREFKEYMMFKDKKEAVDNFWLKSSGNFNRAKELIRVYYNRAKYANRYFTSFTEGWRTDRGMLYIIYGVPNIIYKTDNQERWIYGTSQSMQSMNYTFVKVNNKYTDNDYVLRRSDIYKMIWYQAVETWRNGRVFSIVK